MNPFSSLDDIMYGRYTLSFGYSGKYTPAWEGRGTPKYHKRNKNRAKMAKASRKANRR
jgi:hypothetical protein